MAAQHIAGGCGLTVGIGHIAHGGRVILGHRLVVEDVDQNRDCCAVAVLVGDRHIELIGGRLGSVVHGGLELVLVGDRGWSVRRRITFGIGEGHLTLRRLDRRVDTWHQRHRIAARRCYRHRGRFIAGSQRDRARGGAGGLVWIAAIGQAAFADRGAGFDHRASGAVGIHRIHRHLHGRVGHHGCLVGNRDGQRRSGLIAIGILDGVGKDILDGILRRIHITGVDIAAIGLQHQSAVLALDDAAHASVDMGCAIVASDHAGDRGAVCTTNILNITAASDGALAAQHIAGGCGLTVGIGHIAHGGGVILGHRHIVNDSNRQSACIALASGIGNF